MIAPRSRLAAAHQRRNARRGFLHRGHRRAQPAARSGNAAHRRRRHVRAGILRRRRPGAHRYSVSAGLEGYIWIFPRCGHLSVGICGKGEPAGSLRKRLEGFMKERGMRWKGAAFYSHLLPSLDFRVVAQQPGGRRGLDGGGRRRGAGGPHHRRGPVLCHPLGGPGGALAARRNGAAADRPNHYRQALRRDFAADLEFGSRLAKRVFRGRSCFDSVPTRMVQFTRAARAFRPSCRTCSPDGNPTRA